MITVSPFFQSACESPERTIFIKALFNDTTWLRGQGEDGALDSLVITPIMDNSSGASIGTTSMASCDIQLRQPTVAIPLSNGTVVPYIGLLTSQDYTDSLDTVLFENMSGKAVEYVKMGKFFIAPVATRGGSKGIVKITAYDGVSKLERDYVPNETAFSDPSRPTAGEILVDICTQCGISQEVPLNCDTVTMPITGTCREQVGYIAGLVGKSAVFNRNGLLSFRWYTPGTVNITVHNDITYLDGVQCHSDDPLVFTALMSGTSDAPLVSGDGRAIIFDNPYVTQTILDSMASQILPFVYMPMHIKWRGNPALDVGDTVLSGNMLCPVMSQKITVSGGMFGEIYSYGETEAQSELSTSPTQKAINRAVNKLRDAISEANALINGAKGGVFRMDDDDNDGVNNGWTIYASPDLNEQSGILKATSGGIGYFSNGRYRSALTKDGILGDSVMVGSSLYLGDYFNVTEENGHPVLTIGAKDAQIVLKEEHDRISFSSADNTLLAYWSNNSFVIVSLEYFQIGGLAIRQHGNNSVSFVKA